MQLSKATLKRVSSRPAWALPGLCWSRVRALRGIPPLDGAVPSETGALERERALKASVARRSIAALRVSEGAEAFLRPAALGSACAACCSVCAVGPLPWCCFLRRPLLHLRSLRSLVRRCEKMSIRLLAGAGAAASAGIRPKFGCYKAPYWRSSPSFRVVTRW